MEVYGDAEPVPAGYVLAVMSFRAILSLSPPFLSLSPSLSLSLEVDQCALLPGHLRKLGVYMSMSVLGYMGICETVDIPGFFLLY
jgi:hypothetical protein